MIIVIGSKDRYLRKSLSSLVAGLPDVDLFLVVGDIKLAEEFLEGDKVDVFIIDCRTLVSRSPLDCVPWRKFGNNNIQWIVLVDDGYFFPMSSSSSIHFLHRSIVDLEQIQAILVNKIRSEKKEPVE